jgi:NADH:ubiquinone oxidoreductase subunit B-like Fe-S oxidoreductase
MPVEVLVVVEVLVLVLVDVVEPVDVLVDGAPPAPPLPVDALFVGSPRLLREQAGVAARTKAEAKKSKRARMAHPTRGPPQRKERAGRAPR